MSERKVAGIVFVVKCYGFGVGSLFAYKCPEIIKWRRHCWAGNSVVDSALLMYNTRKQKSFEVLKDIQPKVVLKTVVEIFAKIAASFCCRMIYSLCSETWTAEEHCDK